MDNLLITIKDIKEYRPMAELVPERVDSYIREAQMNDLKQFLGAPLYYDMLANINNTIYQDLLKGVASYTDPYTGNPIGYNGLIPILVYYSLARIIESNQVNITSYGVVRKNVQQSEPIDLKVIKEQITGLRSMAVSYQKEAERFLLGRLATYPLWNLTTNSTSINTGMKISRL